MKIDFKLILAITFVSFLVMPPLVAASAVNSTISVNQVDDMNEFLTGLLENGAELLFTNIDEDGAPAVVYGQLGLPADALNLEDDMYDGCMALAAIHTRGEMLEYVLNLVGPGLFGASEPGNQIGQFTAQQFGEGGFDIESIFQMLGTEFGLMISVYLNLDAATSATRFSQVLTTLTAEFGLGFAEIYTLRIDESIIPPELDFELPFEALDVYIYSIVNDFDDSLGLFLSGLDDSGILGAIDSSKFIDTRGAAGGILAIPSLDAWTSLFNMSSSSVIPYPTDFVTAQFPELTGPLSVAAIGYIDDQVVSLGDTELSISSLIGSTGDIDTLSQNSFIVSNLPTANITGISPEGVNQSYWEPDSSMVIWDASSFGTQSDYTISFQSDDFPPDIQFERTFDPAVLTMGGTTTVTVTVTNDDSVTIEDISLDDSRFLSLYSTVIVTGDTDLSATTLAAGGSLSISYQVTFPNEGGYLFPGAELNYTYNGNLFEKESVDQGVRVEPDAGALVGQVFSDAMANFPEITLGVVGLIGLTGIYSIMGLLRGRGGGGDSFSI